MKSPPPRVVVAVALGVAVAVAGIVFTRSVRIGGVHMRTRLQARQSLLA